MFDRRHPSKAEEVAARTRPDRNRYVDLLRVASIGVVVLGHWMLAVLGYRDGEFTGQNLLEIEPDLQIATWLFQVVPIFFIVGGFTNAASWDSARRRSEPYATWLRVRAARLMRPAVVFVAFWTILPVLAVVTGLLPSSMARIGGREVSLPLWFLASYLGVVALIPALRIAHERLGVRLLFALAGATLLVDVVHFGLDLELVGVVNNAFVWLAVVDLGFLWRDGVFSRNRTSAGWWLVLGGLAVLVVLVTWFDYPVSMITLAHAERSNVFPPTVALLALAVAQMGGVLLVERAANAWLARPRVWYAVVVANSMVMTFYLWNMTAVVLAAVLVFPTGFAPQPEPLSAAWWWLRLPWLALCGLCLLPFLFGFRWAERAEPATGRTGGATAATWGAVVGVVLAAAGFAYLAVHAFPVPEEELFYPVIGVACLVAGSLALGVSFSRRSTLAAERAD